MNKSTPVVSDVEINSRSTAVPNTVSVSALIHVIIIRAFGSAHGKFASETKPFQSRSRVEIPGQARRKERLSRYKLK